MEATSLAAALGALVDYEVNKERKGVIPPSFSVLPCSWQSRAPLNSGGKSRAEWSQRSGAHSCRELPAALYLPWRKERPAAASEAFSLPSIETLWKEPEQGYAEYRGKREWEMEVREEKEVKEEGGVTGGREFAKDCRYGPWKKWALIQSIIMEISML